MPAPIVNSCDSYHLRLCNVAGDPPIQPQDLPQGSTQPGRTPKAGRFDRQTWRYPEQSMRRFRFVGETTQWFLVGWVSYSYLSFSQRSRSPCVPGNGLRLRIRRSTKPSSLAKAARESVSVPPRVRHFEPTCSAQSITGCHRDPPCGTQSCRKTSRTSLPHPNRSLERADGTPQCPRGRGK